MKSHLQRPWALGILGALWVVSIFFGTWMMVAEEYKPVAELGYATNFPAGTSVPLAGDKCTLVLFAHPQCPCTRATLHEIPPILDAVHGNVKLVIVFALPPGVPEGWEQGDLYRLSQSLPAQIILDHNGAEVHRFRAVGSGTALLYSAQGRLLFGGGITPSRGQEGDSIGREAITDFIEHGTASINQAPVFGCTLL